MSMLFKRIKDWAVSITSFRTGDVIPVDGPSGTAKMAKDDLLRVTAENTAASGLVATKLEFNELDEQINGDDGVIASGSFSANDTLFVSSEVSEGDNVVITLKNGESCQVRFLNSTSSVIKSKSLDSETTTWETTIPWAFDKAVVFWNNNPADIEIVDETKIAGGLKDDVQNNTNNISSLSARVTSTENNLFGYDGIVADADFSAGDVVFTKDSFNDDETATIKVTLDEGDGCMMRFLNSSGTIMVSKALTEDYNVWEPTIPSGFDKAIVIWNNSPVHILVVNESRKILSVQDRLDEKVDYDDVYLVEGEKQKRFYSISQGVSQADEDNGTSKYDSIKETNTSWEVSKNTAGVFYNIMKSGKEYSPIISQMFFYNYRKENEWQLVDGQIVPKALEDVDLDDTMQYIDTGKRPLVYAVDAFDCLPNGWYSGEHQQKRKASLIAIVKKAWQQYKAIPVMSWHLENPYTPHAFGTINDGAANYRNGQNITLSDSTIFQYPNTHYDIMGEILNHTSYDDGVEISDDGHWLPSTTSTKCGKGNYFGSDLAGYSAPYLWYEDKMQELAELVNEFVDEAGAGIPIILRLFHEPEDRWPWWGNPIYSGVNTYKSFVQYTITQLRTKFIHKNVLFGYCMDIYWSNENEYIRRYAGDDYIDVVGYDDYTIGTSIESIDDVTYKMRVISKFANDHLKIAALFETGNRTAYQKGHNMLNDYLYKSLSANGVKFGICELWASFVINTPLIEADYAKFMKRNDIRTYKDGDNISVIELS